MNVLLRRTPKGGGGTLPPLTLSLLASVYAGVRLFCAAVFDIKSLRYVFMCALKDPFFLKVGSFALYMMGCAGC